MNKPLTRDEKLIVLIEECGEVIQAATKCPRFGWDRNQDGYGVNHEVLAAELGDLFGIVDVLILNRDILENHRDQKMAKATHAKIQFGRKLEIE